MAFQPLKLGTRRGNMDYPLISIHCRENRTRVENAAVSCRRRHLAGSSKYRRARGLYLHGVIYSNCVLLKNTSGVMEHDVDSL